MTHGENIYKTRYHTTKSTLFLEKKYLDKQVQSLVNVVSHCIRSKTNLFRFYRCIVTTVHNFSKRQIVNHQNVIPTCFFKNITFFHVYMYVVVRIKSNWNMDNFNSLKVRNSIAIFAIRAIFCYQPSNDFFRLLASSFGK